MSPQPSRSDIEHAFQGLLDGTQSRDSVDRWAAQWVKDDDSRIDDECVWWALQLLFGIDLRHGGPNDPYLHPDDQIGDWLTEFRARCAERA